MKDNSLFLRKYLVSFLKAWKIFFEVSFPGAEYYDKYIDYSDTKYDTMVLYSIPLMGMVIGVVAYVFASVVYPVLGAIPSALICSTLFIILWEILSRGKDTNCLVESIAQRWIRYSKDRGAPEDQPAFKEGNHLFMYIFMVLFALRVICLVFLVYYHYFNWIVISTTLIMSVQGYLACKDSKSPDKIYIFAKKREQYIMWLIAAIICIIFSGFHFFAVGFAYFFTLFIGIKMKWYLEKNEMLNGESIGIIGKYVEVFVLIFGLIFITYIS